MKRIDNLTGGNVMPMDKDRADELSIPSDPKISNIKRLVNSTEIAIFRFEVSGVTDEEVEQALTDSGVAHALGVADFIVTTELWKRSTLPPEINLN